MNINLEPKLSSRRRQLRGRQRFEGYGVPRPKPLTMKEVAGVMFTTTIVYGLVFPSPEGVSLGVLMGWLLTHDIPPRFSQ